MVLDIPCVNEGPGKSGAFLWAEKNSAPCSSNYINYILKERTAGFCHQIEPRFGVIRPSGGHRALDFGADWPPETCDFHWIYRGFWDADVTIPPMDPDGVLIDQVFRIFG